MTATLTMNCYKCGDRIETGRAVLTVQTGPNRAGWPTATDSGRPAVDLCGACLDALAAWLRTVEDAGSAAPPPRGLSAAGAAWPPAAPPLQAGPPGAALVRGIRNGR
jgi:hypothetical protein